MIGPLSYGTLVIPCSGCSKAFFVAYRGYAQKSTLYKNLKKFSDDIQPDVFLQRLVAFSRFYGYLRLLSTNADETKEFFELEKIFAVSRHQDRFVEVHQALLALKYFGVVQMQPVVYAAIPCIQRLKLQKDAETGKAFVRLLRAFESFHFVNTFVCSHIGNEVEHVYADACITLSKAAKFSIAVEKMVVDLRKRRAPFEEFRENFVQIEYAPGKATGRLAYIFDRLNNFERKVAERKEIFYPDTNMFRRHFNVEHIEPQNPKPGEEVHVSREKMNNIGNLTVLTTSLNSWLGNRPAEQKFSLMKEKRARIAELPALVRDLEHYGIDPFKWDDGIIDARARELSKESFEKVWKF